MALEVIISKNAFAAMIADSLANYPKEAYGLLFGRRRNGTATIQYVQPDSFSHKTNQQIVKDEKKGTICETVGESFAGKKLLGDYHTHPMCRCSCNHDFDWRYPCNGPSEADTKDMHRSGKDKAYFILSVCKKNKNFSWRRGTKGGLYGSINAFYLKMSVYVWDETQQKFVETEIRPAFRLSCV